MPVGIELHVRYLSGREKHEERTFRKFPLRIGRSEDCHLRFDPQNETKVSAIHAEVRLDGADFTVVDLDSRNGLFLNGKRVRGSRALPSRATLTVGKGGPRLEVFTRNGTRGYSFRDAQRKTESGPLVATDDSAIGYTGGLVTSNSEPEPNAFGFWPVVITLGAVSLAVLTYHIL